jgi:hypothetical protein
MKTGILEFRYGHSANFAKRLRRKGSYTINLGDWIQSLAVQRLAERLGHSSDSILHVDRDSLPTYQGQPVRLIMNACFLGHSFPLPPAIEPVFIGFQTSSRELIARYLDFFKQHQPIGCRDTRTRDFFREQGVDAYITGCLTLTLPLREHSPQQAMTYFIGGEGPGEMPPGLKKFTPQDIREKSIYQHQREPVRSFPLSDDDAVTARRLAAELLETYRTQATRVITPLLHAAGPSLAMGIPVILARKDLRDRFSAINRMIPLYTPQDFPVINWNPPPLDLENLKRCLTTLVARALAGDGGPTEEERQTLDSIYDKQPCHTQEIIAARIQREARPFWKKLFKSSL